MLFRSKLKLIDRAKELDFNFESRVHKFIDLETGEQMKVNPIELQEEYSKNMSDFEKQLKLKCGQYKIDFVPVDCSKGFEPILLTYLLKRKSLI